MYDSQDDPQDKLRELRGDFQAAIDHQTDAHDEAHRSSRYYHNTRGEGQWEAEDLSYLRGQGRPAYSFNLIKGKVNTFVGMMRDSMHHPSPVPVGAEDTFTADILKALYDRVRDRSKVERFELEALRQATIMGEWGVRVVTEDDWARPGFVKVHVESIPLYEIHWDPDSIEPDRSDARYLFWDKWLAKGEFERLYPGKSYDDLVRQADPEEERVGSAIDESEFMEMPLPEHSDMYSASAWNRYYVDRKHKKIRVIHAEYKVVEPVYRLRDMQSGMVEKVSKRLYDNFEKYRERGLLGGLEKAKAGYRTVVKTVQWVGSEILYEGATGQPYDGFTIRTNVYSIDSETGTAYGMVRDLIDPQMEVNKAHSQSLENLVGQSKPGTMAEEGAVPDVDAFEEQMRITGGVAIVRDNALAEGRVKERVPAQYSPAIEQRLEGAVSMLDKISSIHTDMAAPAAQQEAAATVQLRYRKSLLAQADARSNFESFQADLARMMIAIIARSMPEEQWSEYLSAGKKYQAGQGMVVEIDPQSGQPKQQAQLGDLRQLEFDVGMEMHAENPTLRLMEMEALTALAERAPVDPVVLVELATDSRQRRERLVQYAQSQSQAQQVQAEKAAKAQEEQMMKALELEAQKAMETARHNRATEGLTEDRQQGDHQIRMLDIWERADRDEKRAMIELMRTIAQRQKQREDHELARTSGGSGPGLTPMSGRSAVPYSQVTAGGGGESGS